ncbi:MAG: hypothetical protein DRQ88_07075 [Epsilonproteobacteria bacterium]|nr:MAG: hypothetical protein DRQ89_08740 [Campylobacterota bacterium]RLA66318.1 MAG: hypothetical protein DRQ88_07075 [Campylobacterota bacterium]
MIKQNLVIVSIILLTSCASQREERRTMASVSSKVYTTSLHHYSSLSKCSEVKREVLGLALKQCIENGYYKVLTAEDIKCPKKPKRSTLLGAFFLGTSANAPVNIKFRCSDNYHKATKAFPQKILFRTRVKNFNSKNDFLLKGGVIWFKNRKGKNIWKAVPLPTDLNTPVEIGTDAEHFVAIDQQGKIFTIKDAAKLTEIKSSDWRSSWGSPLWLGPGMSLPAKRKAWEISFFSPSEETFYVDKAGNKHGIGVGCTTLYVLSKNGQRITYLDPWLPTDYSYEVCTPVRGTFKAINLSASGSTIFLINKYGDMYTRTYDFDISGGNDLLLKYTYDHNMSSSEGGDNIPAFYEPLFNFRAITLDGWQKQPKINAKITDLITIYKGKNHKKLLRVEGVNESDITGYFEKEVLEEEWKFYSTEKSISGNFLKNTQKDSTHLTLGKDESKRFISTTKNMVIKNFNPYCSPANLAVNLGNGEILNLKLHTRETVRQAPRKRGLSINPLPLNGAIEIPKDTFASLATRSKRVRSFVQRNLKGKRFTNIQAMATSYGITIFGLGGSMRNVLDSMFTNPLANLNPLEHMNRLSVIGGSTFIWHFKISKR